MADLTHILGGPWSPPQEVVPPPIEVQFSRAIEEAGLDAPEEFILDGRIHRFRSGSSRKTLDRSGWYVGHFDGIPCLTFGCWRANLTQTVKADIGKKRWTPAEEMAHIARINAAKRMRDEEIERDRSVAASTVETIWRDGAQASPDHPYLKRKGVQPHGARVTGDGRLMVPLFSEDGELSSLQYISEDGGKLYHTGGQTGGRFWIIGTLDHPGVLYIAEGFATAATIHETTGRPCVVAYSASNLIPVTGSLVEMHPGQKIVIVADNDKSGVGQRHAEQACAKFGVTYIMPPVEGDANDYAQAGHNLALLLNPPQESWLIPADDYCQKPAPIKWLIKGWLQSDALIMIHGPSGGGKTFVVLDWCLRLASGMTEWAGHRVKPSKIVYLAGEGHHGLRARIAAWKQHHSAGSLSMWLSRSGCDLNTPDGYLSTSTHLKQLPDPPDLIVIDTLHRFLSGDENSAQDAKTMLDACAQLMREFNCSVLLVHHTGVSEEAQHRARGSSAWRGALDIEVSIIPAKDEAPMQIVQRKAKDSEIAPDIYAQLRTVEINGWIDEDDEQVTSAIIEIVDKPISDKRDNKLTKHIKLFQNAWESAGKETRAGQPYLSRAGFIQYLMDTLELTEASASIYVRPSSKGKPIGELLIAQVIDSYEHGWIVLDTVQASAMLLRA
jgi:putative DNA primase/helicase